MFQYSIVRFLVASLLLASYGMTDTLTRLLGWSHRPARVRRPVWSHLVGFVSISPCRRGSSPSRRQGSATRCENHRRWPRQERVAEGTARDGPAVV